SGAGLYLSTWTGTGFNSRLVTAEMTGGSFGFALDASGDAHFVYTTAGVGTPDLKYIKQTGPSTWSAPETIPEAISGGVKIDSFLLDADANPHIFWRGTHTWKNGATWTGEIINIANEAGAGADAALDASGKPNTVYRNNVGKLLFSQWTGTGYPSVLGGNPRGKLFMPTAMAGSGTGSGINWTWTDNAPNETVYKVFGSTSPAGPFSQVSGDLAPGSASFAETGLAPGTTYYRYVAALNAGGFVTSGLAYVYLTSGETAGISDLYPASAFPAAGVAVTISGAGFAPGTSVKLKKTAQSDIAASPVTYVSASSLNCVFDLSAAEKGAWDVVVSVPGKSDATRPAGFAVLSQPETPARVYNGIFEPSAGGKSFIATRLAAPGKVTVKVYDSSGRLVRALFDGSRAAGDYTDEWNGRNADGSMVASGVYLIRIEGPGIKTTRRVAVVK
ncbi:MAG TPA: FlgD immunoglobulin-like domain containing protein, partial [Elusimicrobiales bacterium]|nr:FlgD immunoglobulin-like domain containing protein [Elusimicrobiales bacterium]